MVDKKFSLARLRQILEDHAQIGNLIAIAGILVTIYYGYLQLERIDKNTEITTAKMIKDTYFNARTDYLRSVYQYNEIGKNEQRRNRVDQETKLLLKNYFRTITFICDLYNEEKLAAMAKALVDKYIKTDLVAMHKVSGNNLTSDPCDTISLKKMENGLLRMLDVNPDVA